MGFKVVENMDFIDNSDLVKKAEESAIEKALEEIGITVEAYAKLIATQKHIVDTGRLRNSITHAVKSYKGVATYADNQGKMYSGGEAMGTPEEHAVYVGTNVEYAPYIEYGTTKQVARPFLHPAVTEHVEEYKMIFENSLKDA